MVIPQNISDTIQLVKDIGKQYLWVDSPCVIQDDDDDKLQQASIMDSIQTGAELVVVAAAGIDAHAGLPGIRGAQRRISQRIETIDGTNSFHDRSTPSHTGIGPDGVTKSRMDVPRGDSLAARSRIHRKSGVLELQRRCMA